MKEVFTHIYHDNAWGSAETVSGPGSELQRTEHIRREFAHLLHTLDIRSMLDIPCGDFHWMKEMDLHGIDYIGADIVDALIVHNTTQYARDHVRFMPLDITKDILPEVDIILCRDCLFHFSFSMIHAALKNIKMSGSRYLLTTTHTWRAAGENQDISVGQWRRLNLEMPPFNLPPPLQLIVEGNNEGFQEDRALALWPIYML